MTLFIEEYSGAPASVHGLDEFAAMVSGFASFHGRELRSRYQITRFCTVLIHGLWSLDVTSVPASSIF